MSILKEDVVMIQTDFRDDLIENQRKFAEVAKYLCILECAFTFFPIGTIVCPKRNSKFSHWKPQRWIVYDIAWDKNDETDRIELINVNLRNCKLKDNEAGATPHLVKKEDFGQFEREKPKPGWNHPNNTLFPIALSELKRAEPCRLKEFKNIKDCNIYHCKKYALNKNADVIVKTDIARICGGEDLEVAVNYLTDPLMEIYQRQEFREGINIVEKTIKALNKWLDEEEKENSESENTCLFARIFGDIIRMAREEGILYDDWQKMAMATLMTECSKCGLSNGDVVFCTRPYIKNNDKAGFFTSHEFMIDTKRFKPGVYIRESSKWQGSQSTWPDKDFIIQHELAHAFMHHNRMINENSTLTCEWFEEGFAQLIAAMITDVKNIDYSSDGDIYDFWVYLYIRGGFSFPTALFEKWMMNKKKITICNHVEKGREIIKVKRKVQIKRGKSQWPFPLK